MKNLNIECRNSKQFRILKILILILFSISCFGFGASVYAGTVSLAPASIAVTQGQSVSVSLVVDPQGTAYTAKVALSFPAEILSVASFSFASGWMPLSQPGYDSVDNLSGSLVKTAGFAGGFSSPQTFGTVTFVVKSSGEANIAVTGATQVLNASNQNTFTGGGQSLINVSLPAVSPAPAPKQTTPVRTSPVRNLMETEKVPDASEATATTTPSAVSTSTASTTSESDLTAQVSGAKNLPFNILIPIATFLLGFFLGGVRQLGTKILH
ncbi:MAG: cohesin domain-containing protein [bacterium]|nr:cohesin domain-containing protein [bacterium]